MTSFLEHPRGAADGRPGDRSAFFFETLTQLPDSADGKGRGGRRYGRTGIIHTPHGDIRTPAFVPVATQAAMKAVLPETMRELGAQCLLSNAFHLFERPGQDVLDAAGGLARFMNWDGPTFTDSGGFQVLSLGAGFKKTLTMALPTVFTIHQPCGADFIPVGMSLCEAEPETVEVGVSAVLFSKFIVAPIEIIIAVIVGQLVF